MIRQTGLTLIEVLIAVLLLVVGLLGVFALHSYAKRSSGAAANYAEALVAAADMADRIRLNSSQRDGYQSRSYGSGVLVAPTINCTGAISRCSPAQLAAWDRYQWDQRLSGSAEQLAGRNLGTPTATTGCVFVDADRVDVVVAWQGRVASEDSAAGYGSTIQSCGSSGTKRRLALVSTVVAL
ncbi:type IV pilus modification protein PilV [Ferrimonas senticii]|uniref:type IV pilus modification protein PilV n=1 Tax=Ferrimonas senticii TaxID=394566 RepID=UPI00146C94B4|nr:type IV pilus modification protein PilV [Ferrimonas senticii]